MKHILDPLSGVPGIRRAMLFSPDGVPIVSMSRRVAGGGGGQERDWVDSAEDTNAFTALAAGWLTEIRRSVDPLSWDAPRRVVLEASRGTLVLLLTKRATLSVELDRGMTPEELRLPMEAAVARLGRHMQRDDDKRVPVMSSAENEKPPGIFPGHEGAPADGQGMNESTMNEVPEATRDS